MRILVCAYAYTCMCICVYLCVHMCILVCACGTHQLSKAHAHHIHIRWHLLMCITAFFMHKYVWIKLEHTWIRQMLTLTQLTTLLYARLCICTCKCIHTYMHANSHTLRKKRRPLLSHTYTKTHTHTHTLPNKWQHSVLPGLHHLFNTAIFWPEYTAKFSLRIRFPFLALIRNAAQVCV